jgi:alpha-tubulin suppressor-like RCC1 family protein
MIVITKYARFGAVLMIVAAGLTAGVRMDASAVVSNARGGVTASCGFCHQTIAGGEVHSLVTKTDGTLWTFGSNSFGELGTSTNVGAINPTPTQVMTEVSAVAAGGEHSMVLKTDGTLWTFGNNDSGQLGSTTNSGTANPNPTPIQVMTGVSAVAAGRSHSMVLKTDGTLWTFGNNFYGALGTTINSSIPNPNPTPTQVMTGVSAVAAGGEHSMVLKTDGTLWTFGNNGSGQLGTSTNVRASNPTPTQVMTGVSAMAAGQDFSLALKTDGTLWTFGRNNKGQLGTETNAGTETPTSTPTLILTGVSSVAAGGWHSMVLKTDGTLWTFGRNHKGQLGTETNAGTETPTSTPTLILTGVSSVAAGGWHSMVLKTDSALWTFGSNAWGQLGTSTNTGPGTPSGATPNPNPRQIMTGILQPGARPAGKVPAGEAVCVSVGGEPGDFVVANATITGPVADGFATVHTPGADWLASSTNNFTAGGSLPNLTITKIGSDGKICMTAGTATHMIIDVTGFLKASAIMPVTTASANRVLDTRSGIGRPGSAKVPAGEAVCVSVGGEPGDFVVANATITGPVADGFATVHTPGADWLASSTNNFTAGGSLPNLTITKIGSDGKICMTAGTATHMIIDVTGFLKASAIMPVTTASANRVLDTRSG